MIDFFLVLKHHRSALFDFLPILKHHRSTLFHFSDIETPVISSSSSTTIVLFFSVTETPAFHHRPTASFYALKC
jgi:hypothetical protein